MIVVFMLIQLFVSLLVLSLDNEDTGLAVYSPFFVFIYKQFIDYVRLVSIVKAFSKKEKKWHKLERADGLKAINVNH